MCYIHSGGASLVRTVAECVASAVIGPLLLATTCICARNLQPEPASNKRVFTLLQARNRSRSVIESVIMQIWISLFSFRLVIVIRQEDKAYETSNCVVYYAMVTWISPHFSESIQLTGSSLSRPHRSRITRHGLWSLATLHHINQPGQFSFGLRSGAIVSRRPINALKRGFQESMR
jgi:hypothetical protein